MPYTQEQVEKVFADAGCILLSEYKNVNEKLEYVAVCGHQATTSFELFRRKNASHKCPDCSPKITYTEEQVRRKIEDEGCKLVCLRHEGKYKVVDIICRCGHPHTLKFEKFCAGQGRLCTKCVRPRGGKHHNFNPNLTSEDRLRNRDVWENIQWRRDVYNRDGFACTVCKSSRGGDLEAHHLNGWADFPDERFDVGNGVTLCEKCHRAFHAKYGFGKNTREQFESWKKAEDNTEVSA